MSEAKELSIIIVNYKSKRYLSKCIASIYEKSGSQIDFEIILVSADEENLASFENERVRVVGEGNNLGFGSGNNLGARTARGKYLMFLNPDTEILSKDIQVLLDEFKKDSALGVLGPKLLTEKNEVQWWSAGREVNLLDIILNNLGFIRSKKTWDSREARTVDWVSGCAMIISRELFQALGGFDEKFFMYFEDIDLCRRIKSLGKKIGYFPSFSIKHLGGGSHQDKKAQKKDFYISQDYYFEKHLGKWQAFMLKFLRKMTLGK